MQIYFFDAINSSSADAEDLGELEGMFTITSSTNDSSGNVVEAHDCALLDCWASSDGRWRSEYFNGFMAQLDIEVMDLPEELYDRAVELMRAHQGY